MATIADIRQQYPQYDDLSDLELAKGFHRQFYSDIPFEQFSTQIGLPVAAPLPDVRSATMAETGGGAAVGMPRRGRAAQVQPVTPLEAVATGVFKGAVVNPALAVTQVVGGEKGRQITQKLQKEYEQTRQEAGMTGFDIPELAGALISPVNRFLPGGPVTQAATGAMLNPVTGENLTAFDVAKGKIEQGALGAIFGKTFEAALPAFKEGATKLLAAGAELQPGQAFSGVAGGIMRTAEGLRDTLFKILGKEVDPDSVNKAFTYVTVNEALSPVGKVVSKTNADGFALVNQGIKLARQSYDEAFNKVGTVTADADFMSAINNIRNEARNSLDPKEFTKFEREITNNIINRFKPQTTGYPQITAGGPGVPAYEINGQGLHNIKRFLQARLENLANATDELGMSRKSLYEDVMNKFKDYTYRIDSTGAIKAADTAYANIYRVAGAAKSAARTSGNFSPEQLATTAASQSTTLTGGAGTAPLQQYAKEALKIVGKDKTGNLTPSDLKNLGVASGLGYAGLFNPTVLGVAGLFGLTAEALGKLALRNPNLYEKFRTEALKNSGLLGRASTLPEQQQQQQ